MRVDSARSSERRNIVPMLVQPKIRSVMIAPPEGRDVDRDDRRERDQRAGKAWRDHDAPVRPFARAVARSPGS